MKTSNHHSHALTISEKSIKPPGKPRFVRTLIEDNNTYSTAAAALKVEEEPQSDSDFCRLLLTRGYVQSYVDFYHLTNRGDPHNSDPRTASKIKIPLSDMKFLHDRFVHAEVSRRRGNTTGVYSAYNDLAAFYVQYMDWKTAIFFHEKCLEVSQLTADIKAEMAANHALGLVYQKTEEFSAAVSCHERHYKLAVSVDQEDECCKANLELYKVYDALARKLNNDGRFQEALELYQKCLEAAKKSWNKAGESAANGNIGDILLRCRDPAGSIEYLKQFSKMSAELNDAEGRCRSCSQLALAYESLGQSDKAVEELKLVQSISEQAGDIILQSQACRALGTLHSKVGKLQEAVAALQRHFDLIKILYAKTTSMSAEDRARQKSSNNQNTNIQDLDLARAYLGISKGNLMLGAYSVSIKHDFTSLLDWKLNRSDFKQK